MNPASPTGAGAPGASPPAPPPSEGIWAKVGAIAGAIGTIVAIIFGITQCHPASDTAASVPASPAPPSSIESIPTTMPQPTTDAATTFGAQATASTLGASQQYLSELSVTDLDRASSTGDYTRGSNTINGTPYGHSVTIGAGCQNDDGGDFWIDYSIDGTWKSLSGMTGITDKSSTQSTGTFKILNAISGQVLASGGLHAGPAVPVKADLSNVVRLRIFMTDPNSPKQLCGFEKIHTALVLGDFTLSK